ncbi:MULTISPECIES: hypothetical protein [Brevibacillus]|jgi:hypothetical protein|uniref:DUF937 domain-containing protein n=1 Tax=Brevibacillus aydinogluensis TaxID=927786 RepID=A0AA48RJ34_9BACL|nr:MULTISPECIES: hypothetical protein [Brevibacillus]MBR8658908.1 hypothetical protein [Brevibacillus sp. NL20B1]CAJ1004210.1 DUF937 domain-containing protein [Brevibacillus aydinogluensis]
MGDLISDLLGKLSKKTGRNWTMEDIVRLAQKLPKGGNGNLDEVFDELSDMGLNLSEETRVKVKEQLKDGKPPSLESISALANRQAQGTNTPKKEVSHASAKVKSDPLAERLRKWQDGRKKRR